MTFPKNRISNKKTSNSIPDPAVDNPKLDKCISRIENSAVYEYKKLNSILVSGIILVPTIVFVSFYTLADIPATTITILLIVLYTVLIARSQISINRKS